MIEIGNSVVSVDLITSNFACDLKACKGACCVSGDSGAPLEQEEAEILKEIFPVLRKYLREESVRTIEELGTSVIDMEQDTVTPLNNGKECAYVVFEHDIAFCGIEKAFRDGAITFQKPVSCHLYPVRIKKYTQFDAVNYDQWEICRPAIAHGNSLKMPVYRFTQEALKRKYGVEWFKHLVSWPKTCSFF